MFYNGKKKNHTLKTQVIYHPHSRQILSIEIRTGREHDIQLAKRTLKLPSSYRHVMTDLGYYGLPECGFKLLMPIKKVKKNPKCKEVKAFNRLVSRYRIKGKTNYRSVKALV